MSNDCNQYKRRLREFLQKRGVEYKASTKTWRCPNHNDADPSATLYDKQDIPMFYCPVCEQSWTVIDLAGIMDGVTETKDKIEAVKKTLGIVDDKYPPESVKNRDKYQPESVKTNAVPLTLEQAREIYQKSEIQKVADKSGWGQIVKSWPYHDQHGNIIAMDVRFENEKGKQVVTWYYNGKTIATKNYPKLIYNLADAMSTEKPLLIVEGAKCAEIARALNYFCPVSWNGGSGKAHLIDWSVFADREIFILPDNDDPGIRAAKKIKEQLPQAKIIKPVTNGKGDDIEQFLQIMTQEELTKAILDPRNILNDSGVESVDQAPIHEGPPPLQGDATDSTSEPFKILGIGDDGRANFIDHSGRLQNEKLTAVSKNFLRVLAPETIYWSHYYDTYKKEGWEKAVGDIVLLSQRKDFDRNILRGRGAWRDGDKVCYFDGKKITGETTEKYQYAKSRQVDIGINDEPIAESIIHELRNLLFKISFETKADAVRCMGWATLAPFAGALKFRPSILLTGPSGSGKTTVQQIFIRQLSACEWLDMKESSTAGVRSLIGIHSRCVVFDEAEKTTEKMKMNMDDILSFMRSNFTIDAPDAVKGTKEGGWVNYKLNSMFGLAAIDPTIEKVADENRIFRINFIKAQNQYEWNDIEKRLTELLCDKNCRAIRAYAWKNFKRMEELTERVAKMIMDKTGRGLRKSYSDAMLASAFIIVWNHIENPSGEQINEMLDKYYELQPMSETRDESEEFIDRYLDEIVEVIYDGRREKITLRECLTREYIGEINDGVDFKIITDEHRAAYRQTAGRYGVRLLDGGLIGIASKHHEVMRIMQCSNGYSQILKRHPGYIKHIKKDGTCENDKPMAFADGSTKRAIMLNGIMKKKQGDKTQMELLDETMFGAAEI